MEDEAMPFEKEYDTQDQEEIVRNAMEKIGLAYEPNSESEPSFVEPERKSPSDVALDRFRTEYGKRVRAAAGD